MRPAAEEVAAAAQRLRGHVVATPVFGAYLLPGGQAIDVRVKAELLQPGSSLAYRGCEHFLLGQRGRCAGLLASGAAGLLRAAAVAARGHRLPLCVFAGADVDADSRAFLVAMGAELRAAGPAPSEQVTAVQRQSGWTVLPGAADAWMAAGVATVGLELARELPRDTQAVYVAAPWGDAVAAGLAAAGLSTPVVEVPVAVTARPDLAVALRVAHGLGAPAHGLAVLAAALSAPRGPVGALLAD